MVKLFAVSVALAGLLVAPARAQDHAGHDMSGMSMPAEQDASALPPACEAAAEPAVPPAGDLTGGDAMTAMHRSMMRAATIADPDMSFNCGMIAHHKGAIAMAEAELERGRDAASKRLATAIIEAQEREIAEMTGRVEALAR